MLSIYFIHTHPNRRLYVAATRSRRALLRLRERRRLLVPPGCKASVLLVLWHLPMPPAEVAEPIQRAGEGPHCHEEHDAAAPEQKHGADACEHRRDQTHDQPLRPPLPLNHSVSRARRACARPVLRAGERRPEITNFDQKSRISIGASEPTSLPTATTHRETFHCAFSWWLTRIRAARRPRPSTRLGCHSGVRCAREQRVGARMVGGGRGRGRGSPKYTWRATQGERQTTPELVKLH